LQTRPSLIDPTNSTQSIMAIIGELEGELAKSQAELTAMRRVMSADAPQVVTQSNRISALNRQIDRERSRLAGSGLGGTLNSEVARFEEVKLELDFATEAYKSAVTSLEASRIEASKKLKRLAVIAAPTLADDAQYPDRIRSLVTVLAILLIGFGIFRLSVAFVRDHRD
jgi:capsular polysaccharide transport system permease protein